MTERTRLHISPFNPNLLNTVVPLALQTSVSNISYHSLQTFPERNYGYIELPVMEATKLKKKLNGSILKGSKVKVEEARPVKKQKRSMEDDGGGNEDDRKDKRAIKKQKREDGVVPGFELPKERKVKRGWTEPTTGSMKARVKEVSNDKNTKKDRKAKVQPSSFSKGPECLFRTKLPSIRKTEESKSTLQEKKSKKLRGDKLERETVVHEFSNTTEYPTFLRTGNSAGSKRVVSEYVDGTGWVNQDGEVIELPRKQDTERRKTRLAGSENVASEPSNLQNRITKGDGEWNTIEGAHYAVDSDETSSSGASTSSDNKSESEESESEESTKPTNGSRVLKIQSIPSNQEASEAKDDSDTTSTSGDSSSLSSDEDDEMPTLKISSSEVPAEVHPLEALFKRPRSSASETVRKPQLEVKTSFSFFESEETNATQTHHLMPQTPFTQRDLQHRSIRSAAPTPDTAAPNKSIFGNLWGHDGDTESNEDETAKIGEGRPSDETPRAGTNPANDQNTGDKPPESDFTKWFWEHRGETNRAWKKRLREAKKDKRQKENKKRARTPF